MNEPKPRKLGRGLSGLIADLATVPGKTVQVSINTEVTEDLAAGTTRPVPIDLVDPSPFQPRREFSEESISGLADSIRRSGVMQPIVVRASGPRFELVAGERRLRAARLAGLTTIPAMVRDLTDEQSAEIALVENIQREDLNPMERAFAFVAMADRFGLTHAEIAERIGIDRSTVANFIRLTELEEPIRDMVARGRLSVGHGKALLGLQAGETRLSLAESAAAENWTVRALERAAEPRGKGARSARILPPDRAELEKQLSEHFGTKVRVETDRSGKKGRVVIEFYGLDHFDGLMSRLNFAPR